MTKSNATVHLSDYPPHGTGDTVKQFHQAAPCPNPRCCRRRSRRRK